MDHYRTARERIAAGKSPVSSGGGGGLIDRLIGTCVGVLIAAFALYCAVKLIEAVLPALMVAAGVVAVVGLLIGAIVVFRTWRDRW